MATVVLVIDMINDFVTGKFENSRAKRIIPAIANLLESARKSEKPVIYVSDSHPGDDEEFSIWGPHAVEGSKGSEIIPELKPEEKDHTLSKTKYSAFYDTDLDSLLKKLDVDEVILTGVLTHICIQHTAADAFFRGYKVVVPRGCVEDISDEKNESSLRFIEKYYNAKIMDLDELLPSW